MRSVKPDSPVDTLTLAVMREVDALLRDLGLAYFLCGAMARDILLQHVHGIDTGIATKDVDFGVTVENWKQFENIRERLFATGRFHPAKDIAHRFHYKININSDGYPLDIIPFGGVEQPPNSIAWQPDRAQVMNVMGYDEALTNAITIRVASGFSVPVTSLPGLTLLKLFAWADRGLANPKDALDLVKLLRTYHAAGNEDRLYGEELPLLESAGFDLAAASPQLLGKDVQSIAKPETLTKARMILDDQMQLDRLITHMAPGLGHAEDAIGEAEQLLQHFKSGLGGTA